jgi:hypothetical protein
MDTLLTPVADQCEPIRTTGSPQASLGCNHRPGWLPGSATLSDRLMSS